MYKQMEAKSLCAAKAKLAEEGVSWNHCKEGSLRQFFQCTLPRGGDLGFNVRRSDDPNQDVAYAMV